MSTGTLLVVASQRDAYASFAVDLYADGLTVTTTTELPSIGWTQVNRFDCTILDRSALTGKDYQAIAFCIKAHPVVLVTDEPLPWLDEWVAETISPPLTSQLLLNAVQRARRDRLPPGSGAGAHEEPPQSSPAAATPSTK